MRLVNPRSNLATASENNWGVVRLILAVVVIYGHSYLIFDSNQQPDLVTHYLLKNQVFSGKMAVVVFFFLSGMVVTQSLFRCKTLFEFAVKRFARLFPGLVICLAFTTLVVSPLMSSQYNPAGNLNYFLKNISLFTNTWTIPGLFESQSITTVNGSLWTLPHEVRLYFCLGVLSIFTRSRQIWITTELIVLFYLLFSPSMIPLIGTSDPTFGNMLYQTQSIFFVLGSLFYFLNGTHIRKELLLLSGLALYVCWTFSITHHLMLLSSIVLLFCWFSSLKIPILEKYKSDLSYGTYIYGFLISQCLAGIYPKLSPVEGFMLTVILTIIIASISWRFVEMPSIKFARKYNKSRVS